MLGNFKKYISRRVAPLPKFVKKIAPEPVNCKNCSMCYFYGSCYKCNLTNK